MHLNENYRTAARRVELNTARVGEQASAVSSLYSIVSGAIINYAVPVIGMLPARAQDFIKARYLPSLEPRIATASSAVGLGLIGYLLTQLPGDGSFAISYDFPHKLSGVPGQPSVIKPVTVMELSPQLTKALAWYLMLAECGVRLYSAEVQKKAMAFGRPIPALIEALYRGGRKLVVPNIDEKTPEVVERHALEDTLMVGVLSNAQQRQQAEQEGMERFFALTSKREGGK